MLNVELPCEKDAASQLIINKKSMRMLSAAIGNWMLDKDNPVYSKEELLAFADSDPKVFADALIDRICDCGNYNDYKKFFELINGFRDDLKLEILEGVEKGFNLRRSIEFIEKCKIMRESIPSDL